MAGRNWYEGPVQLRLIYRGPESTSLSLLAFMSGIMDSLDGCQGPSFIYLPIAYLDDCQVTQSSYCWINADTESYELEVEFLDDGLSCEAEGAEAGT
jgi:hypothetical protein